MNRTRVIFARAARRLLPGILLLAGLGSVLTESVSVADSMNSPYVGDPVLTPTGSSMSGGTGHSAPTLRVRGLENGGNSADLDPYFQVPGGGYGVMGRIGHIAGQTIGRDESLTHINLQPYMFVDQNMFFSDLRMYRLNEGGIGGNIGGGWRVYLQDHDAILGAVGYYDVDDTRGQEFQQMGLSLEWLSRWLDVRANWYIPFGETEQILGTAFIDGSEQFVMNSLLIDTVTTFGNAGEGVDVTLTSPVPWEIFQPYNVEASAGFYHYQVRDTKLESLWGYRLRVDASFFDRMMHMFVELNSDRQTRTQVILGASLDYYGGFESRTRVKDRQFYRMSEWVRRNYNVVTVESNVVNEDVPVINPDTGLPYFIVHVANNPTFGGPVDGTVENPFEFINNAIMAVPDADVYYVWGGSTFIGADAEIMLPDNKILLGEKSVLGMSVPQELPAAGFGLVPLPVQRPGNVTLSNAVGNAITAGDNVVVDGFQIINPSGNGINIDGVASGEFRDLTIRGAQLDGILMMNPTGVFRFEDVTVEADDGINGAGGIAFHINGGSAQTTVFHEFSDLAMNPTFENSGGNVNEVILIENTTGGFVNLAPANGQTTTSDDGGGGIRVLNNLGAVTLSTAQILNTDAAFPAGVEIRNNASIVAVAIDQDITIDNAANIGLLVEDLPAGGNLTVGEGADITVDNRNSIGADFRNVNGQVNFFAPAATGAAPSSLTIGPLLGAGVMDPAIRFSQSTGRVSINNIFINGSLAEGILIGDVAGIDVNSSTAQFIATGMTTINNVGLLDDPATPSIRIQGSAMSPEASGVDFQGTVNINTRLARGIHIENASLDIDGSRSRILFSGTTTVNNNNATPSGLAALFIQNGAGTVAFNDFIANNNILVESAIDIQNVVTGGGVSFNSVVVNNATGTGAALPVAGLFVDNVANFSTVTGLIDVLDETAVNIQNSGYQVVLESVNSINTVFTPEFGIGLFNNDGMFTITGNNFLGSGGQISGAGFVTIVGGVPVITGAGLFADDADEVEIRFQDYLDNVRGLDFQNMNEDVTQGFALRFVQVFDSGREGVRAIDVRNILIEDSTFQDNGSGVIFAPVVLADTDTIGIFVTEVPDDPNNPLDQDNPQDFPYTYTIQRNLFNDTIAAFLLTGGSSQVSIRTLTANARGARLDLFFLDNNFPSFNRVPILSTVIPRRPSALLFTDWDGIINADILRNTGTFISGSGMRGFDINQTHPDDPVVSQINLSDNTLMGPPTVTGSFLDGFIGANFSFSNTVFITVDNNTFDLGVNSPGVVSDALRFNLMDFSNLIDITDNTFLFTPGPLGILSGTGTGVHVQLVNDQSNFFMENNQIGAVGREAHRGFRFDVITGTANLFGTVPNIVEVIDPTDPDNFFSIGIGNTNGQFNINGVFGP